jgi:hypothetical protein
MKTETLTVFRVGYHEFEDAIKKVYGRSFSFVEDQEARNDSNYLFKTTKRPPEEWEREELEKFRAGKPASPLTRILLDDLARRGEIEPGYYLISVCW